MKVYISNYRNHWVSPYTVLEKVLFWLDWENISYDTPWVEKWSNRIQPFSQAWMKFLDTVHPPIDYVKIDYYDTWSMDHTLSPIIAPMLKQLQSTKHGSPMVDDEDAPEHLRSTAPGARDGCEEWDSDNNIHDRWEWVLNEMIWAFTQLCNNNHEAEFWDHSACDPTEKDLNKSISQIKCNRDGLKAHQARIANGTRLFGKYYQALWD
jgi:hypothetical protein